MKTIALILVTELSKIRTVRMLLHIIPPDIDTNSIKSNLPTESRFYVNETGSAGGTQKALGIATYSYQAYEAGGLPPFLSGAYQNELSIIQGGKSRLPSGDGMVIFVA